MSRLVIYKKGSFLIYMLNQRKYYKIWFEASRRHLLFIWMFLMNFISRWIEERSETKHVVIRMDNGHQEDIWISIIILLIITVFLNELSLWMTPKEQERLWPPPSPPGGGPCGPAARGCRHPGTWSPGRGPPGPRAARPWRWCGGAASGGSAAGWGAAARCATGCPCSCRTSTGAAPGTAAPSPGCRSLRGGERSTGETSPDCRSARSHARWARAQPRPHYLGAVSSRARVLSQWQSAPGPPGRPAVTGGPVCRLTRQAPRWRRRKAANPPRVHRVPKQPDNVTTHLISPGVRRVMS